MTMAQEPIQDERAIQRGVDLMRLAARALAAFRRREREDEVSFQEADIQEVVLVAQVLSTTAFLSSVDAPKAADATLPARIEKAAEGAAKAAEDQLARLAKDLHAGEAAGEPAYLTEARPGPGRPAMGYPRPPYPPVAEVYWTPKGWQLVILPYDDDSPGVTLHGSPSDLASTLSERLLELLKMQEPRQGGLTA